jgi:hypothetical protein
VGHVARMVEMRPALKMLVGKPEGKKQLRRLGCSWEENICTDIWRALVDTVMNLWGP